MRSTAAASSARSEQERAPEKITTPNVFRLRPGWIVIALLAITVAAYSTVWTFDFVNLDDPYYVQGNLAVAHGLTWPGVQWAFTTDHASNWHPLTWISHMVDVEVFGMKPGPHHLVNLLLHVLNTLLLFGLLHRMTGATGRSALVAALFAVHPLHVESVVWISERKDVLSTLFFMLTLWAYAAYARKPALRRYVPVCVLLALGLMAKPMLVTLPFVLLLLDVWPLKRIGVDAWDRAVALRLVVEKIPLFALVAASSVVTFIVQHKGGAVADFNLLPLSHRLANSLVSYFAYIGNMVWPSGLTILYPFPDSLPLWKPTGALALLLAATVAAVMAIRRYPYVTVGWFWYLGMLVPVIGIVQVGSQAMADRYTYIPLIGLFLIIAWGGYDLLRRGSSRRAPLAALCVLMVATLAVATWNQSRHWRDSKTLWARALTVTTENWRAHTLYGTMLAAEGLKSEAIVHFTEAIRIQPVYAGIYTQLGAALTDLGRPDEAIPHYRDALRLQPDFAPAHDGLGNALAGKGLLTEAISHFAQALRANPNNPISHFRLGSALDNLGRVDEAITDYKEALRLRPDFAPAHSALGNALAGQGLLEEAVSHYEQALSVNPDDPLTHNRLAVALAELGRTGEAIPHYREARQPRPGSAPARISPGGTLAGKEFSGEAISRYEQVLRANPNDPLAHYRLGVALAKLGRPEDAIPHYREALRLQFDFAPAHNSLGNALAGQGFLAEAISHYKQALDLEPDDPLVHNGLGSTLDDLGRVEEAIAHYRKALEVDPGYAAAHNNLAAAYAKKGRLAEAVGEMRAALQFEAGNADYHYNFAVLISQQGDIVQARRHLETALSLNPQFEGARQALALLGDGGLGEDEQP